MGPQQCVQSHEGGRGVGVGGCQWMVLVLAAKAATAMYVCKNTADVQVAPVCAVQTG